MVYFGENPQSKKEKHVHYWIKAEDGKTERCKCGEEQEIKRDFPTLENIPHRNVEGKNNDD
ncbi:MAG: hypothetical protein WA125_16995 [Desulfosporosinus sp.]